VSLPETTRGVEVFFLAAVIIGSTEVERTAARVGVDVGLYRLDDMQRAVRDHLHGHYGVDSAGPTFAERPAVAAAMRFAEWFARRVSRELA
jgi:hypothetical protein